MFRSAVLALTIGLAAFLLFILESIVGKQLLPLAGGGPMIWNTCLVFFQVALLLAYLLAFSLSRWASFGMQACFTVLLVLIAVSGPFFIRSGIISSPPLSLSPQTWLWTWLSSSVLIPFVALATLSPLLQHWWSRKPSLKEPYPLYAASNLGSFLGILAYPVFLERSLDLPDQRLFILMAMLGLAALLVICVAFCLQNSEEKTSRLVSSLASKSDIINWVILTAVPSSLLLGVTGYILTDISALPLFWVVPLLVYLATFALAFSALDRINLPKIGRLTAFLALPLIITFVADANHPATVLIPLHLAAFSLACLYCHGLLVSKRPKEKSQLTAFYLWIAFGGALGGVATLLLAPLIFSRQLEYPIALLITCLIRAYQSERVLSKAAGIKAFCILLSVIGGTALIANFFSADHENLFVAMIYIPAGFLVLSTITKPFEYSSSLAVLLVAGLMVPSGLGSTLSIDRNFFGVTRVTTKDGFNRIIHGSTIHGIQEISTMESCEPASYYHRSGPAGEFLTKEQTASREVLVIGLGVGSLACFANANDRWTFFEINPAMERIARDSSLFSFLKNSGTKDLRILQGDGRRLLASQENLQYDTIVVDAFSSDSIPTHLLTIEAFKLYQNRLKPGGSLLFHISNRYFNLRPILAKIPLLLNMQGFIREDLEISPSNKQAGKTPSVWVSFLPPSSTAHSPKWQQLTTSAIRTWTDDFSDPIAALSIFQ